MASDAVGLDLVVMHHPSRKELLDDLLAQLDDTPRIRVETDPAPSHVGSAWRTARLAWSDVALPGTTHRVVLQDDAWPCPGFYAIAKKIIRLVPWAAVAFWVGEDHVDAPLMRRWGGRLCPLDQQTSWAPTVALALPITHALAVRPHGEECHQGSRHDDEIIACYLRHAGVPLLATVPCLVDHPGAPSLTGLQHQGSRRAALWVGGTDPSMIDWRLP